MQGTQVRALVWEDPTCRRATRPVSHNYWAWVSGACVLQRERQRPWEARAPRWRVVRARHSWRKPSHRNEDPTRPKIKKERKKERKYKRNQMIHIFQYIKGWGIQYMYQNTQSANKKTHVNLYATTYFVPCSMSSCRPPPSPTRSEALVRLTQAVKRYVGLLTKTPG